MKSLWYLLDNRMENLEWCTNGENILHADRTGLRICAKGEETYASKLTEKKLLKLGKVIYLIEN